ILVERFPEWAVMRDFTAMLACIDGDQAAARKFMSLTGATPNLAIWRSASFFENYRKWCFSGRPLEAQLFIRAHTYPIFDIAWSHDGERLVTASADKNGRVKIWDARGGKLLQKVPIDAPAYALALGPR